MKRFLGAPAMRNVARLVAAWALVWIAPAAQAAPPAPDSLWLISTRGLSGCEPPGESRPQYWYLGQDHRWLAADSKTFLHCDDPHVPTVVFLHGNRFNSQNAAETGSGVYRVLMRLADGRPFRFVIWSWPSDRIAGGNRLDVQVKAARSELESCYLAHCVRRIQPDVSVTLIGHSFGARAIGGALKLLVGEEFAGRKLSVPAEPRRAPLRAVLVAAGMDNTALLPGSGNGLALSALDRLLIAYNPEDWALHWYRRMYHRRGPDALGYTGPACPAQLGADAEKMELLDLSCEVGRHHPWEHYLRSPSLRARMAWYAFLAPSASGRDAQRP
jgi:esterase/lipase superfamily enzyme